MCHNWLSSRFALLTLIGLGAIACGAPTPTSLNPGAEPSDAVPNPQPVALTIAVAASVQDAMTEVQAAYQQVEPNVTITYTVGSSGSLAQQIIQGAPTDIFLSASPKWMDELAARGDIVADSRRDVLQNSLVLVVPANAAGTVTGFADLRHVDKVAIGEPASVPAGQYAQEVLTALNLFDALDSQLVFGKHVRQVLAYVETGNVDAGIVYATDAKLTDRVTVITTAPANTHSPIIYPIAIVQDSDAVAEAEAFLDFLGSDTAIAIFQEYGFDVVE